MDMITVEHISKSFGSNKVLDDLNMILEDGQVSILMGKSGCGKTTFANILVGLLKPDSGTVSGMSGKKLSMVFQEDRLCEQLSAIGNIRLVLNRKIETYKIIEELSRVGLDEESARKPASQLSGGQKRRVAIVRAMMAEGDFVCLDEPFKGLDRDTKNTTMYYVKKNIERKTVLLITHDSYEADYFDGKKKVL